MWAEGLLKPYPELTVCVKRARNPQDGEVNRFSHASNLQRGLHPRNVGSATKDLLETQRRLIQRAIGVLRDGFPPCPKPIVQSSQLVLKLHSLC